MSRSHRCALFCLLACLLCAPPAAAQTPLGVNEPAARLTVGAGRVNVSLAVNNATPRAVTSRLKLELLDPLGNVQGAAERDEVIEPGATTLTEPLTIPAPLAAKLAAAEESLFWYRLRYQLAPGPSGVLALSEITPGLFEINLLYPAMVRDGEHFRARLRAAHPLTALPAAGVRVTCALKLEDDERTLKASAVTGDDGLAACDFDLPRHVKADQADVSARGERDGLAVETSSSLWIDNFPRVSVNTDKPLYQPGQTLHLRALAFDQAMRAVTGGALEVKITDPEGTVVYRAAASTSRFGVASVDWPIPDNVRLGDYEIRCRLNDAETLVSYPLRVRISRYDLPNFAVGVKPDRAYYLPGQSAEVTVRGDYLFGRPLTRGHVRVIREGSREWNFREQKWEIEEEEKIEGELDAAGRFVTRLDLAGAHGELAERGYNRFQDVSYTAYVTDPTTGRTEQRRFDLRVTREAIHAYVIDDTQPKGGPLTFYVTTFYADGSPAACDVAINEALDVSRVIGAKVAERWLRTVRTNRYGVAKVSLAVGDKEGLALRLTARDSRGAVGHETRDFDDFRASWLRVETDRAIYRPGQPVRAVFRAAQPNATLFAEVMAKGRVIRSGQVALRNGKAGMTFAYDGNFQGEVMIAAYAYDSKNDAVTSQRRVLYPSDSELKLNVKMSAASYRPGAEADASFTVSARGRRAIPSALGVAVVDRAVAERARTDIEYSPQLGFTHVTRQMLGDGEQLGGVTLSQLSRAAASGPISADLELVGEVLLRHGGYSGGPFSQSGVERQSPEDVFSHLVGAQLLPIRTALDQRHRLTGECPADESQLAAFLEESGIDWPAARDPWDTPYRPVFRIERDMQQLRLVSAGVDKRFDTADDFTAAEICWPYFSLTGKTIDYALRKYHDRTGRSVRDREALRAALLPTGIDINALPDRWGRPYEFRFGVSKQYYTVEIVSGGPDRQFGNKPQGADDFTVWVTRQDYFAEWQARVDAALTAYVKAHDRFPQDDAELDAALAESDIARADLRDGWGHMPYAAFKSLSRYADRVRLYSFAQYGEPARQKTEMTPVTQLLKYVTLRSAGADGAEGTADDFDLGNFSRLITEQAAQQPLKQIIYQAGANTAQAGALGGLVVDPQNALVPGAKVKATSAATGETFEATTDDEGRFLLLNLPAGTYEVRVDAQGFQPSVSSGVPVQAAKLTEVSVTLSVGTAMEAVMVTASAPEVQTQSVDVAVSTGGSRAVRLTPMAGASARQSTLLSTPRLREYFPETLVWQPSIETDAQGRASLRFKLADNITTWRLAVMASTADGRVGVAEADVTAFQPFFVEHDPPRVLTAGDEISLPVVVRNYLDRRQAVQVELSPADWFRLLGPSRQRAQVNAGDAARVTFDFRAAAPIKEGPQRVTAKSREAGDAIERRVSVHPDGEEVTATASQVFGETTTITTDIPETAIADTARGEVKIYPNLSAHVLEAIEAIMQRPYGCAEQAISSAYPSLLALRLYEGRGDNPPPLAGRARRYVQAGYERLLSYRDEAGGFSYWGRGEADVALTAYALQFLSDASRFVSVDERVMNTARDWLVKQQRADGSWSALDWRGKEDSRRMAMLTAVAARALARVAGNRAAQDKGDKQAQLSAASLDRALNYLSRRAEEIDEPYLIAAYALAASDAHQRDRAARVTARLAALARKENDSTYWSLETNTPYYGWGLAGRVETTALAVQALALSGATDTEARSRADAELINRGLLFLLRQKDRYGVWYSTQASVQALAALSATLSERETRASGAADTAEVIVNGKRAATLAMPRRDELTNPLTVDVSSYLTAGSNRVEIRRAAPTQASAQLVASHYEPWGRAPRESESNQPLRLKVAFDKTELKAGDEVTCHVEAERVGFDGYGMMLAEVGLPPGADVDRASLDRAMSESGWDFSQYDVLPDRLIVYLWPQAGGTRFAFKFKPRYGLKAQTAPSVLYDYYNPEARVTLAPTRFVVR